VDNLLFSISQVIGLRPASKYEYENFRRWFDVKNPIVQEEIDFLRYPHDMIALGGSEEGWLFHKIKETNSRIFSENASSRYPITMILNFNDN